MPNLYIYNKLYEWYETHHRILPWRETEDAYLIWLSEVILQQTRVAQGMDYYMRFAERWRTVEALAAADEAEVLREWQGLGYYSRARNLHKAARMVVERGWAPFPTRFEDIRSLPGIGDYTAGAIASFAYNQPYPAVDGNVYRVVARLLDLDEPFDTTAGKKLFRQHIDRMLDREHPRLFNSAIMEFGALHCTPVLGDACESCPLQDHCAAHAHGTAEMLPVRKERPKVRDRWLDYHIYVQWTKDKGQWTKDNGQWTMDLYTVIRRRENPKDIWYHLYEFPCEEHASQPSGDSEQPMILSCTHVLSHQRLHARFFLHQVDELPTPAGSFRVALPALDDYALSRLSLRALDRLYSLLSAAHPSDGRRSG